MIITNKFGILVGYVYFDEQPNEIVDIVHHVQCPHPIRDGRAEEFHTILLDLTKSQTELFANFRKGTRNEIRRASEKDHLSYQFLRNCDADLIRQVCNFYDQFAALKGLRPINRKEITAFATAGVLRLSMASQTEAEALVWHVHYVNQARARLLYSASLFRAVSDSAQRALTGRANRYLHWQDLIRFKEEGVSLYDFGGWYHEKTDEAKLRINQFKEDFGGTAVKEFNCTRALTLKGKLALFLRGLVQNRLHNTVPH